MTGWPTLSDSLSTGVFVSLATGGGHFAPSTFELADFGSNAGGWSSDDTFPRELADVNGDGLADIVGFASTGVVISLATGDGHFAPSTFELGDFGSNAGGWSSDDTFPRELADVNGDGMADIVEFASTGVVVSLATGDGHFAPSTFELPDFGSNAGGWSSDDTFPRELADVNGDGLADIVGFASTGVVVSLATGDGHFAPSTFELPAFGTNAGGWSSDDTFPRELADVNGDGLADIVGFASTGVVVSLATGEGHFAAPTAELPAFGTNAGGWSSDDTFPRELADVDGNGLADIVGFASTGVVVSLAARAPALSIVKTGAWVDGDGDGFADVGEAINYTFAVTNEGNVTLTNVTVEDTVGGVMISGGPTTLDVGETDTATFTGEYIITQADIDAGTFTNVATADSDESDEATDAETVPLPQNPALLIVKTGAWVDGDGDGFADVGEAINYTFVVPNVGNVTLTNVTVEDLVGGVTITGGPTTLDVGETDTTTFTGVYLITQADIDAGTHFNVATANSDKSNPTLSAATVPLPQNPALAIDKVFVNVTGGDGDALADAVGDVLNYTVTVTNTGNVTLTGVTVVDPLTGQNISGVTLAPGATQTFNTSYTLTQADLDGAGNAGADGDIDNTATADSQRDRPGRPTARQVPLVSTRRWPSTRCSSTSPAATATRWPTRRATC